MGLNKFLTVGTVAPGGSGLQPAIDLQTLAPPSGLASLLTFITVGNFSGTVSVEGSTDQVNWSVLVVFDAGIDADANRGPVLRFSPKTAEATVRFLRLNVRGAIVETTTVSVAGEENEDSSYKRSSELLENASGSNLLQGEIVRLSGNSAVTRAQANIAGNVQGTVGAASVAIDAGDDGVIATNGKAIVRLEPALAPLPGEYLWVSATTAGRATNVEPGVSFFVGTIKDTTSYAADQTVIADLSPMPSLSSASGDNVSETLTNAAGSDLAQGEVVRISANLSVTRAQADVIGNTQGTVGVAAAAIVAGVAGSVVTNGKTVVKLEAGLVPLPGDYLWVSPNTAGRATNVEPPNNFFLGTIKDTSSYAGNQTVVADLSPMPDFAGSSGETVINGAGSPLALGEVIRVSADNTVTRAQADAAANLQGSVGCAAQVIASPGTGEIRTNGLAVVLLEAGLVGVAAGQYLWISAATAGRATNVAPTLGFFVGTIKSAASYGVNNTVLADISPMPGFAFGGGKLRVTTLDLVADFLSPKVAAGTNITTAVLNPGGNEQLQINVGGLAVQQLVYGSAGGAIAQSASLTYDPAAGLLSSPRLALAQGAIAAAAPNLSGSVTWNNAAVPFTGWQLIVTDTASAAGSTLLDIQDGAVPSTVFKVGKGGTLSFTETGGPALLTTGAIPDTYLLARSGANIIGTNSVPGSFISGLAAGQVVYGGAGGAVAQEAEFSYDAATDTLTVRNVSLAQGTLAADKQSISSTATWNNIAVAFTAWKLNVTNSASAAGSKLLDLQVGSSPKFSVLPTGAFSFTETGGSALLTTGAIPDTYFLVRTGTSVVGTNSVPASFISGLAAGQVVYGGAGGGIAQEAEFSYDAATDTLTVRNVSLAQGTLAADKQSISSTGTWNNGAVAFTAWKLDITNSASAAGSKLLDLQVGSSPKFSVLPTGAFSFTETGGPTLLTTGAIPDNYFLVRSGTTVIGTNSIPSGSITGLTQEQVVYGAVGGGVGQNANLLWRIANGTLEIGSPTSAAASVLLVKGNKTIASAAGAVWAAIKFDNSLLSITGNTGITSLAFTRVNQPTLQGDTATCTITSASTLYIENAPVAGGTGNVAITNPWALNVAAGASNLAGQTYVGGAGTAALLANSALVVDGTKTVSSAAGATWRAFNVADSTLTLSGGTGTTLISFARIGTPSINTAATVVDAAALYLTAAPSISGGGGAITNPWAFYVAAGDSASKGRIQLAGTTAAATFSGLANRLQIVPTYSSVAAAAGSIWRALEVTAGTLNLSGAGNVTTTALNTTYFGIPTITADAATKTVTDAATVCIAGPPVQGANTALTNTWSLYVPTGDIKVAAAAKVGTTDFDTAIGTPTYVQGRMFYQSTWQTVSLYLNPNCTLQIGQEDLQLCYNNTGAPIADGKAVYVTGAYTAGSNNVATIALAVANDVNKYILLGLTTAPIPDASYGFVCTRGNVNDVDTSAWAPGTVLYLSDVTPGLLTSTAPTGGNYKVRVGRVLTQNAVTGRIDVRLIIASKIGDLANVDAPSPNINDTLIWNGTFWANGPGGGGGGGSGAPGIYFYQDDTNIIPTSAGNTLEVNTLSKTPVTTTPEVLDSIVLAGAGTAAGEAYLYNTALFRTQWDGGIWTFNIYASVNTVAGGRVSTITQSVYLVSPGAGTATMSGGPGTSRTCTITGGTPFVLADANANVTLAGYVQTPTGLYQIIGFTSSSVVTIAVPAGYVNEVGVAYSKWGYKFQNTTATITSTGTNYALYSSYSFQPTLVTANTDKIGEIVFGTSNNATTINWVHNGTLRDTNFETPLATLHNFLQGLQGGSAGTPGEFYHLTNAQWTAVTAGTNTQVLYYGASGYPTSEAAFVYDATNNRLTVENAVLNGAAAVATTALGVSPAKSVAAAAGAIWRAFHVETGLLTITGASILPTTITSLNASYFGAPTITAANAQTVDAASTVYIAGAPSATAGGGATPTLTATWALNVAAGNVNFAGTIYTALTSGRVVYPDTSGQLTGSANFFWTASSSTLALGAPAGAAGSTFIVKSTKTVTSAAGAVWNAVKFDSASQLTLTGTTGVTAISFFAVQSPTITDASSVTVTSASTMNVANIPASAGSVTMTNAYALSITPVSQAVVNTIVTAASLYISAAPVVSGGSITRAYAMFSAAGVVRSDGNVYVGNDPTLGSTTVLTGTTIAVGQGAVGNQLTSLSFIGDTTYPTYGFQISRDGTGVNANTTLYNRGTGTVALRAGTTATTEEGTVTIGTGGADVAAFYGNRSAPAYGALGWAGMAIAGNTLTITGAGGSTGFAHNIFVMKPVINRATNPQTVTYGSALFIEGAPTAGTGVTITYPYAIMVSTGNSWFGGNINANSFVAEGAAGSTGGLGTFNQADLTLGATRSAAGASTISFISNTGSPAYNFQINRASGANGVASLTNNGTGDLIFNNSGAGTVAPVVTRLQNKGADVITLYGGGTYTSSAGFVWDNVDIPANTCTLALGTTPVGSIHVFCVNQSLITSTDVITVTDASSIYIMGPPTSGGSVNITNPWSLQIYGGDTSVQGRIQIGAATAAATFTSLANRLQIVPTYASVVSATTLKWRAFEVTDGTLTITGSTGPIAHLSLAYFGTPTITDVDAVTVTNASTVYIAAAPAKTGAVTLTKTWAFYVAAGNLMFSPGTNQNFYYDTADYGTLYIGRAASASIATPSCIDMGGSFSNADATNLKIKLYNVSGNVYGFGVSSGKLNYCVPNASDYHIWYIAGLERFRVVDTYVSTLGCVPRANSNTTVLLSNTVGIYDPALATGTGYIEFNMYWDTGVSAWRAQAGTFTAALVTHTAGTDNDVGGNIQFAVSRNAVAGGSSYNMTGSAVLTLSGGRTARTTDALAAATFNGVSVAFSGNVTSFYGLYLDPATLTGNTSTRTIAAAYTLYVAGAPVQSTRTTITNAWGLYVASSSAHIGQQLKIGSGNTSEDYASSGTLLSVFENGSVPFAAGTFNYIGVATHFYDFTTSTGTVTAYRNLYLGAPIIRSNAGATTVTNVYGIYLGGPNVGSNMTATTASSLYITGPVVGAGGAIGTSYTIFVDDGVCRFDGDSSTYVFEFPNAIASGANAVTRGSLGPIASLTIKEWLKCKGPGGADRYIELYGV